MNAVGSAPTTITSLPASPLTDREVVDAMLVKTCVSPVEMSTCSLSASAWSRMVNVSPAAVPSTTHVTHDISAGSIPAYVVTTPSRSTVPESRPVIVETIRCASPLKTIVS